MRFNPGIHALTIFLAGFHFMASARDNTVQYYTEEKIQAERISIEKGLSNVKLHCIYQDCKGFMWFGTNYSLDRYDGFNMKVYTTIPFDTTSLTMPNVWSLLEDPFGDLLIGTSYGGIEIFNPKTDRFSLWSKNFQDSAGLSDKFIYDMLFDQKANLWLGTEYGLCKITYRIEGKPDRFIWYQHDAQDKNKFSQQQNCIDP